MGLAFNACGKEKTVVNDLQFEEINQPVPQQKEFFSLDDLFSNLSITKQQKTQKKVSVKEKKDYFAEDFQAFAEDDPWDIQ